MIFRSWRMPVLGFVSFLIFSFAVWALFFPGLARAQSNTGSHTLPGYLRPLTGGEPGVLCFNELPVRSAAECDALSEAILRSKRFDDFIPTCLAKSWKSTDRLACVGMAMGFTRVSGQARKEAVTAISEYRKSLAAAYIRDQEKRAASQGETVNTTTFDIAGQDFTLPNSMRVPTKADYTGIRLWTNLDPNLSCPEAGFVLVNFVNLSSGEHPFLRWTHDKRWPGVGHILKKTFSDIHRDPRLDWACRDGNPDVTFYFLENGTFFGGLMATSIRASEWSQAVNYMLSNFDARMLEYTNQFSRYKQ